ncbi:hypothetical protein B0T25DRAFT_572681 [Lasiosphaeria hispida]|uniref:Glycoside hydrolase family 5 domain-containing protein n=1 Tax=Lasiosphaeria hispida TaxID=260671 RepID=A0AAJ0M9K6_9PEZI|nr:hypothetical protein B0T25DRAFT_572681 [Lasiosphaeria hispida]
MIPEGLHYQSIASIVTKVKSLSMNAIRVTYATLMIDQIYSNNDGDVSIGAVLIRTLGRANGIKILDSIASNPGFTTATTRLEVFDAVAHECARRQIYIHLDNHISRAGWCCIPFDGNA